MYIHIDTYRYIDTYNSYLYYITTIERKIKKWILKFASEKYWICFFILLMFLPFVQYYVNEILQLETNISLFYSWANFQNFFTCAEITLILFDISFRHMKRKPHKTICGVVQLTWYIAQWGFDKNANSRNTIVFRALLNQQIARWKSNHITIHNFMM